MEFDNKIDLSKRKFSSRLIVERALFRGWRVVGFKTNPAIFKIFIPRRKKAINIFSASPQQMSYVASKIAKDKYISNCILKQSKLPVPSEVLLDTSLPIDNIKLDKFLSKYKKVVVKPLDASHGKGITVGINNLNDLIRAIDIAKIESKKSTILLQQHIEGVDIRVLCIDYRFVDSISRIPAFVVGDGVNNIQQLIANTNTNSDRGENYKARLNKIPLNKAIDYLGKERLKYIPQKNKIVQVIGVSNIGMGGERHNIKNDIPKFLKDLAEEATKALDLPVCGVDFIVKKLPKSTDTIEDLAPIIIEVNECPMLTMYDDLYSPEQNKVIDTYLDYLAKI